MNTKKYLHKNLQYILKKESNKNKKNVDDNMAKPKLEIVHSPEAEILKNIKEDQHLNYQKLSAMTGVNRGVLERFMSGTGINHFDFIKIKKIFPEIDVDPDKILLETIKLEVFGTVIKGGICRHLLLNEPKKLLIPKTVQDNFGELIIGVWNLHSHTCYIVKARSDIDIFKQELVGSEFLVKTKFRAYYGVIDRNEDRYVLTDQWTLKEIVLEDGDEVLEAFDLIIKLPRDWSNNKAKTVRIK